MRESKLTEESKPAGKKRVHPAAIAGPAVAIGAALFAVFISTSNKDKEAPPAETAATAEGADPLVSAQFAPETPQPPVPAAPSANAITHESEDLTFSLTLPSEADAGPIVARLRKESEDAYAKRLKEARDLHAEARADGRTGIAWEYQASWSVLAHSGEFVSLVGTLYEFSGGAHGMTSTDTRLANMKTGAETDFTSMLRMGKTVSPALVIAACEAVKKAKMERIQSASVLDEPIVCAGPNANVKLEDGHIALAPSTVEGKFGGIYVYFDQYAVGSYAEGAYQIVIQHDVFAEDLKPEFKALFAGSAPDLPEF